jgi:hypothetical protein
MSRTRDSEDSQVDMVSNCQCCRKVCGCTSKATMCRLVCRRVMEASTDQHFQCTWFRGGIDVLDIPM